MNKAKKIEALEEEMVSRVLDGNFTVAENDKWLALIANRCHYIVTTIWDLQGKLKNLDWWDFDNEGGEDGPSGYFNRNEYKKEVGYVCGYHNVSKILYEQFFPTRWLWQDFEEELTKEIKNEKDETLKKIEMEKIQKSKRNSEKQSLINLALSKLTKEEIRALREKWQK